MHLDEPSPNASPVHDTAGIVGASCVPNIGLQKIGTIFPMCIAEFECLGPPLTVASSANDAICVYIRQFDQGHAHSLAWMPSGNP